MVGSGVPGGAYFFRREMSPFIFAVASVLATGVVTLRSAPQGQVVEGVLLLGICAVSMWGWYRANRLWHYISDTPLSKIETAAQGYVELQGDCELHARETQGFASGPPCVWQSFRVQRRDGVLIDSGISTETFLLTDKTGKCIVNPDGAMVLSSSRKSWIEGSTRYSVRFIRPGASLYVLGMMQTTGGSNDDHNRSVEVSKLLRLWKNDPVFLLSEFDSNGDGKVDVQEWQAARERADVVAGRLRAERSVEPVTHLISRPRDGSPFLISDKDPAPLGRVFLALSWLNIALGLLTFYMAAGRLL